MKLGIDQWRDILREALKKGKRIHFISRPHHRYIVGEEPEDGDVLLLGNVPESEFRHMSGMIRRFYRKNKSGGLTMEQLKSMSVDEIINSAQVMRKTAVGVVHATYVSPEGSVSLSVYPERFTAIADRGDRRDWHMLIQEGLTQEDIAKLYDVSQPTVSRVLRMKAGDVE